jgi:hypothetical protein
VSDSVNDEFIGDCYSNVQATLVSDVDTVYNHARHVNLSWTPSIPADECPSLQWSYFASPSGEKGTSRGYFQILVGTDTTIMLTVTDVATGRSREIAQVTVAFDWVEKPGKP